jgi:hypothetical protein
MVTSPDGDIAEDQTVTATGSYSAAAPLSSSGPWIMQMVAFKTAGSSSPCDLNADGSVNVLDVQMATDMGFGSPPLPCTAPSGFCNGAFVQRVLNNALGQPCALPVLGANPSVVNFGSVIVGGGSTQTASLSVTGTGSTTISQATVSGAGFSISGLSLPLTLAAGQSTNFNVAFTPTTTGTVNGSIVLVNDALAPSVNATLLGAGVNSHTASLSWTASTSPNVAGYNVYRIASSSPTPPSPPYTKVNSSLVPGLSYTDATVLAGQSYYYYATTVDTSNNESAPSNIAQAVVPVP